MPLKSFKCSICGKSSPKDLLRHDQFQKRMKWIRDHRKRNHPKEFKRSYKDKRI